MMDTPYVVEPDGVRILTGGGSTFLPYPEAAVWDLLSRGEPLEAAAGKLGLIAGLDLEGARALVNDCARRWMAGG